VSATQQLSNVDVTTLADLPFHVRDQFSKSQHIRQCQADGFDDVSSRELFERIRELSLGFNQFGLNQGDRVALVADSCPEWTITDLAILTAGAVTVPIYPTLAAGQMKGILADCAARLVIVSDETQAEKLRSVRSELPNLEAMVVIEQEAKCFKNENEHLLASVAKGGRDRLVSEDGLEKRFRDTAQSISPDAIATIIYTSGTTGEPKGVMLTHQNLLSNLHAVSQVIPISSDDTALSFLPLSHSLERMVLYKYLYSGVTVAFAESLETIKRDLLAVRPTVMSGVPRVYEKVHARVLESVSQASSIRQLLFRWALQVGRLRSNASLSGKSIPLHVRFQHFFADRLVFSKIRSVTGGRLREIISGGAPLGDETAEFFFAIGLPITEGYGLTETAPVLTVNPKGRWKIGTVGVAIPGVTLRIADDGEVLARGPNIMAGYFNMQEATQAVLRDGWFYTGDIGTLDEDGYLTITDRKKDILVTASGKNVAPGPIESLLKRDPMITEAVLIGDRRRFITALIVPNLPVIQQRMVNGEALASPLEELLVREDVRALFQSVVDEVNGQLSQFEQVKRFALLPTEFTIASGELTPTMKVRRRMIENRWKIAIEELYVD
jgi:long-chain acyl-CoA synthetase